MKGKYCVLFAMGDVLVDTGSQYVEIWRRIGDKYGAETDYLVDVVKEKDIKKILAKYFSQLTQNEKDSLVNELRDAESKMTVREIPGASRFVKELKDQGVKMGLVTNFTKRQVDNIVKQADFIKMMDTVITADDVEEKKPDQDGYVKAANNLGYDPKDCFVFEDSFKGIEAAQRAGMNIIALSTTKTPQELRTVVPTIIPDFTNFSIADLNMMYSSSPRVVPVKNKKSNPWIFIILLLLILLGLFFLWRTCRTERNTVAGNDINSNSVEIVSTQDRIQSTEPDIRTENARATRLTLPDGTSVNANSDGMEAQIVSFLNSDDYRDADDDDLSEHWFDFDNIRFVHGSSSELKEDSYTQLDNLAQILKQYQNVKIKVGGYADRTGTDPVNERISQQRANNVKSYLVNKGVPAANIITEGFSDEFAKHSATAPDSQRAEDRTVVIRFVK